MSDNLNATTSLTPVPGSNTDPMFYESAAQYMRGLGNAFAKAQRMEQAAWQSIIALIMLMAKHGGKVPASVKGKKPGVTEDASSNVTWDALRLIDTQSNNRESGIYAVYRALSVFTATHADCGMQTANDLVKMAARMVAMGYDLEAFNGTVVDNGGDVHLAVEQGNWKDTDPAHLMPGVFQIKPEHVARREKSNEVYPNAKLVEFRPTGPNTWAEIVPEHQRVAIIDKQFSFRVKDGADPEAVIYTRVGRKTFMDVTTALLAIQAKEQSDKAKEQADADKAKANATAGEGQEEGKANAQPSAPAQPTSQPSKPGIGNADGTVKEQPTNVPAQPQPNGSKVDTSKADVDQTREDKEKLEKAIDAPKIVELARLHFTAPRIKSEENVRRQAMLLFAQLHGVLKAAGYSKVVADPTEANIKAAIGEITTTSARRK